MKVPLLKITTLFSYCGGPLFVADLLKPHLHVLPAFLITFIPVGLVLVGAFHLDDDIHDRLSRALVSTGRQSLYIVLAMHVYALWCFMSGTRVSENGLYYSGIAVGVAWGIVYLRAARRWMARSLSQRSRPIVLPQGPSNRHEARAHSTSWFNACLSDDGDRERARSRTLRLTGAHANA